MKRAIAIHLLGLCALAVACSTTTESPPPPRVETTSESVPGHAVRTDVIEVSAVVEAIDHDTRMVTFRDADGKRTTFRVDESVRNLPQVSKGDMVDVTYYRSLAVNLRKPGEATPGVSAAATTDRARLGDMPGAASAETITMVARVRALDRKNQTATLQSPTGELMTIAVRNPAHFDVAKVGDLVEITYTEAVAIAVEKPNTSRPPK